MMDLVTSISLVVLPVMATVGAIAFYKAMRLRGQLRKKR